MEHDLTCLRHNPEKPSRFETKYLQGLEQLSELIELGMFAEPRPLDPFSLSIGKKTFDELSISQIAIIRKVLFAYLAIDLGQLIRVDTVNPSPTPPVPGRIKTTIYATKYTGMFLQEWEFSDRKKAFLLGPSES